GPNGAGKTTLISTIAGLIRPDVGSVKIHGHDVVTDFRNARKNLGVVPQELVFDPFFTVRETLRLQSGYFGIKNNDAWIDEVMHNLDLTNKADVNMRALSGGMKRRVLVAQALVHKPPVIVLDEPTATLTPSETEHLFKVMRELRRQGVAIIFISHHLEEIFEICDRITVLRDGELIGSCLTSEVDNDRLVEMMVGRRIEASFPPKPQLDPSAAKVIEVEELQLKKGGPVSRFALRKGEILGFAGLVGSGRTETVLAMLGAHSATRRKIKLDGVETRFSGPDDALMRGIGLLPESRKEEGLITSFSILQNISLNNYGKYRKAHWFLDLKKELEYTTKAMAQVQVKAQGPYARVDTLSGGNQQKIVIARWLNHDMRVLIFDEPTRGIDVGAKAEIYSLMREFAARGHSIIMISSELPEVIGMSDRVCVFRSGGIVATVEGDDINSETIMTNATTGRVEHVA
ncbi:MAG TPA: ribonucleotide-diphosphate reductase subunit alpha, partial [Agrobacterium sp.]|nr:ribonucleotide-diphosphate reductase subunit alpha [Agrobacterium sp.]